MSKLWGSLQKRIPAFYDIKKDYLEAENLLFLSILGILIVSREERKK